MSIFSSTALNRSHHNVAFVTQTEDRLTAFVECELKQANDWTRFNKILITGQKINNVVRLIIDRLERDLELASLLFLSYIRRLPELKEIAQPLERRALKYFFYAEAAERNGKAKWTEAAAA